jgi:DNA repair exonuclease SbcCD ATPase subunit
MYRILSLTLDGFKRIILNEIRKITITPSSNIQLILGTNGCGKSSLLDQLTPLPADKNDFFKGGSKTIVIESRGHTFICTSRHNGREMEHSFIVDDEEQNPGGTGTVQTDLCKKYFKVTEDSHELMRGNVRFTQMLPAKRREWLLSLCDSETAFALEAYDKIKKRANQLGGAVDMNRKNLGTETAKIMSEAEEAKLEQEVTALLAELQLLQAERMPVEHSSHHHMDQRTRALQTLHDVSMRLLRNKVTVPYAYTEGRVERDEWGQLKRVYFPSLEALDQEIDRLKHIVTGKEATLVAMNEQFNKLQRQADILAKAGAEGIESLTKRIQEARQKVTERVNRLRLGLVFQDARNALQALETIEMPLVDQLRLLPSNSEESENGRRYGRARYEGMQQQWQALVESLNKHVEYVHRLNAQKEHADLHRGENKHTCPQCHHSWVVGINEEQYAKLLDDIREGNKKLRLLQTTEAALKQDMEQVEAYFTQYRDVMSYTKTVTALRPFWEHLVYSKTITEAPLEAVSLVQQVKRDLAISVEIQELEESIEELTKLRAQAEEVGDANLSDVRRQIEALTEQLGVLTADLTRVQRSVADYSEYRRQLHTGLQLGEELKRLYGLVQKEHYDHIEAFRRESIQHCLREVENALSLRQESLRAAKRQRELVEVLQRQVKEFEIQEQAAKTMVKALSPTHGLIAEGLLGFLRAFVAQMNTYINQIWLYPLQLIPTGYDHERREQTTELDYKFKVMVDREDNIVKDIAFTSDGQKEMIDLAFKEIALRYMDLSESPHIYDEAGKTFDDEHRDSFSNALKWKVDNTNCPQLFMVSHYAVNYSSFSNAQLCVIDDRNVVLPSGRKYNEHVHFSY